MEERGSTTRVCPHCNAAETGIYDRYRYDGTTYVPGKGYQELAIEHHPNCADPSASGVDCYEWDRLTEAGNRPQARRPFGPSKEGSPRCQSGSLASGGTVTYCTCDTCF